MKRHELPEHRVPPPGMFMTQWVIYDHPKDHPGHYVLRATYIMDDQSIRPDGRAWLHKDVNVLRMAVPEGFTRMPRQPEDDPVILEVWI